jgi:spore coat protein U-like protein
LSIWGRLPVKLNRIILSIVFLLYAGIAWGEECKFTTSPLNFGNYDPFSGAPLDATCEVNVTCDAGLAFTVKLDQGKTSGGNFQPRVLGGTAGSGSIRYNLYRDSARQQIWGDGTGNTFVVTGTGTGSNIPFTVYGRIPARQNVRVGSYITPISVIVEW